MVKSEGLIRRVTTIATGLLLAALLAVLVLLWGERPAEAAFPGANGKIVFAGRVMRTPYEGQDEIFKMNPDGSNATRLTHNTGHDYDPAWSSDGQKIAFTREEKSTGWYGEIYIMDPNGRHLTRLTNTPLEHDITPAWSPDGQKIAFVSGYNIYVMDTDPSTDDAISIFSDPSHNDAPTWSPDGQKIAFVSYGDGDSEIY